MGTIARPLAPIGIDIGKELFYVVGFGTDGKIAFRLKIKRLALVETFKRLPFLPSWLYDTSGEAMTSEALYAILIMFENCEFTATAAELASRRLDFRGRTERKSK